MTIIGIDLGTTNSVVAAYSEQGVKVIPNALGMHLTPSIISVGEDGEILIGEVAKQRLVSHPHVTVSIFKRYMGTNKTFQLGDYEFTPEDLSSFIIRALKEDAEAFLGEAVTEAVISVPAYFNDTQRNATKRAGQLAGLKVERLINEPTAAAVAYGLHLEDPNTRFLVFDLGGGTFDVSILERFEDLMEVQAVAGDNFLGGEDFTDLVIKEYINLQDDGIVDKENVQIMGMIRKQAEIAKRSLSQGKTATIEIPSQEHLKPLSMSSTHFEELTKPLLHRLRQPIERAIRDAAVRPAELDAIILVGGATRMPIISSFIAKMFGRLASAHIDPDESVAIGAAIQAGMKARNRMLNDIVLTDVCPYTLGIRVAVENEKGTYDSGHFSPIIERNSVVPVSKVQTYYPIESSQKVLTIAVYQGESRLTMNNIKLGEFEVELPVGPKHEQAVDVRFTYDINGILEVETCVVSTKTKKQVIFEEKPGQFSKEQIEQRFKELSAIKIHPRERMEIKLLIAKAERLYEESLGNFREHISIVLRQFEGVLNSQKEKEIRAAAKDFKEWLEEVERFREL